MGISSLRRAFLALRTEPDAARARRVLVVSGMLLNPNRRRDMPPSLSARYTGNVSSPVRTDPVREADRDSPENVRTCRRGEADAEV